MITLAKFAQWAFSLDEPPIIVDVLPDLYTYELVSVNYKPARPGVEGVLQTKPFQLELKLYRTHRGPVRMGYCAQNNTVYVSRITKPLSDDADE